ncbi:hypothetical protein OKA06_14830 [Novosphingobium sp. MW5]|nr:hypothetical protein [Novosphingobium sp. MW5]
MTGLSVLAMAGGLFVLGMMPQPKNKQMALAAQCGGGMLFALGLLGIAWSLAPPLA